VDNARLGSFTVYPIVNGLSDHGGQYLILKENIFKKDSKNGSLYRSRSITKNSIQSFLHALKNETWDNIYAQDDVNAAFNSFLHTFLINFESCFPVQ
jgi:hypothetical protein